MEQAEYDDIEGVNFSTLKNADRSPRHYLASLDATDEDTTGRLLGRLTHCAVFEPDELLRRYVIWDGDRRGKAFAAFAEQHQDKGIIKPAEYDAAIAQRDAVRSHPVAGPILARGRAEVVLRWTDEETGLQLKGRVDWLSDSAPCEIDMKGTRSCESRVFGAEVARNLWHVQQAMYRRGLRAWGLDLPPKILAVEYAPPFDCAVFGLDEDVLWAADVKLSELLRKVAAGKFSGKWPGRYETEQALAIPAWAFPQSDDDDLAGLLVGDVEAA